MDEGLGVIIDLAQLWTPDARRHTTDEVLKRRGHDKLAGRDAGCACGA